MEPIDDKLEAVLVVADVAKHEVVVHSSSGGWSMGMAGDGKDQRCMVASRVKICIA